MCWTKNYKKLILVDNAESALYDIQQEFRQLGLKNVEAIVADVRKPSATIHQSGPS